MVLNRGQWLQLNIAHAVAIRTTYFVEALLFLYAQREETATAGIQPILARLAEYRRIADELDERFGLGGDPHDIRPVIIDQVYRIRDALNLEVAEEMTHYGSLDPDAERFLRQHLATLHLLVDEIAREIQRLSAKSM